MHRLEPANSIHPRYFRVFVHRNRNSERKKDIDSVKTASPCGKELFSQGICACVKPLFHGFLFQGIPICYMLAWSVNKSSPSSRSVVKLPHEYNHTEAE